MRRAAADERQGGLVGASKPNQGGAGDKYRKSKGKHARYGVRTARCAEREMRVTHEDTRREDTARACK